MTINRIILKTNSP